MISASLRKFAALVVVASPLFIANTGPVLAQATITVSAPNCSDFIAGGTPGNRTLTCVPSGPVVPGAPTGCVATIQTAPSPLTSAGGTATVGVSAGCSATGPITWTRNGSAWSPVTDQLPANTLAIASTTTYTLTACNGTACATPSTVTATVPGTGGVTGGISCANQGYSKTMFYNWNWSNPGQFVQSYDDSQGPIGTNGIVVIAFKPTTNVAGSVSVSEYPGGLGNIRIVSISTQPCDFSQAMPWTRVGYNTGIQFSVGTFSRTAAVLQAGTQYYLNIANRDANGLPTCSVFCDVRIQASRSGN